MPKLTARDVSATQVPHSGAWEVAAMVDGYRKAVTYYFCGKREAVRSFLEEVNAS